MAHPSLSAPAPPVAVYPPVSFLPPVISPGLATPGNGWRPYSDAAAYPLPALVTPSFSMPSSLAPTLQNQVTDMHNMFASHDDEVSLASYSTSTGRVPTASSAASPYPPALSTPFPSAIPLAISTPTQAGPFPPTTASPPFPQNIREPAMRKLMRRMMTQIEIIGINKF